ncbi:MAG: hypothetical protein JNK46_14030 [Methylobacteriaceae bacterium]|nr:hypothetical protein [Methylobacteriaceae bacterium]
MAAGFAIMLSGLDLSARKEGRAPRIDATRMALGGLLDAGGVAAILFAILRG